MRTFSFILLDFLSISSAVSFVTPKLSALTKPKLSFFFFLFYLCSECAVPHFSRVTFLSLFVSNPSDCWPGGQGQSGPSRGEARFGVDKTLRPPQSGSAGIHPRPLWPRAQVRPSTAPSWFPGGCQYRTTRLCLKYCLLTLCSNSLSWNGCLANHWIILLGLALKFF